MFSTAKMSIVYKNGTRYSFSWENIEKTVRDNQGISWKIKCRTIRISYSYCSALYFPWYSLIVPDGFIVLHFIFHDIPWLSLTVFSIFSQEKLYLVPFLSGFQCRWELEIALYDSCLHNEQWIFQKFFVQKQLNSSIFSWLENISIFCEFQILWEFLIVLLQIYRSRSIYVNHIRGIVRIISQSSC